MAHAEVSGNSLELSLSMADALLYVASAFMTVILGIVAGWQVATVALGVSVLGAAFVSLVQALDA